MRTILYVLVGIFAFSAMLASAADIDGKWVAEVPGRDGGTRQMTYTFKADGETLTGSMSTPMGEQEITDGKVNGNDISFAVVLGPPGGGEGFRMEYKGTVSGNELKLVSETPMGTREMTAKKVE